MGRKELKEIVEMVTLLSAILSFSIGLSLAAITARTSVGFVQASSVLAVITLLIAIFSGLAALNMRKAEDQRIRKESLDRIVASDFSIDDLEIVLKANAIRDTEFPILIAKAIQINSVNGNSAKYAKLLAQIDGTEQKITFKVVDGKLMLNLK